MKRGEGMEGEEGDGACCGGGESGGGAAEVGAKVVIIRSTFASCCLLCSGELGHGGEICISVRSIGWIDTTVVAVGARQSVSFARRLPDDIRSNYCMQVPYNTLAVLSFSLNFLVLSSGTKYSGFDLMQDAEPDSQFHSSCFSMQELYRRDCFMLSLLHESR
jgi:hypothetical protein